MASTEKTPPDMARLQELADAWERGEALKLLPAEVEDEIFDALPWLLARVRELTEALRGCIPWVATSPRGAAQEALAVACKLIDVDPYAWSSEPTILARRIELLGWPDRRAVLNSEEPKPCDQACREAGSCSGYCAGEGDSEEPK